MDMYVKMSRFNKGYSVTLKAAEALVFYGRVTPIDKYGYTELFPMFEGTPAVDPQAYYTISTDGEYVYWSRNYRLSPVAPKKPRERKHRGDRNERKKSV